MAAVSLVMFTVEVLFPQHLNATCSQVSMCEIQNATSNTDPSGTACIHSCSLVTQHSLFIHYLFLNYTVQHEFFYKIKKSSVPFLDLLTGQKK